MNYIEIAKQKVAEIESLKEIPDIEINKYIDYTLLRADATYEDLNNFLNQAILNNYYAVCINPYFVPKVKEVLRDKDIKVCSVVGFPIGCTPLKIKLYETEWLLNQGVDEIDMVINISALKSKDYKYVEQEIKEISKIFNNLKVIIETCLLTDEEKIIACEIIKNNGAKFVKTSTGFSKYGATLFDVALLRAVIGNELGVKASGGIRDKISAIKMILAGANRIGTSSAI
ncbi:MAG: deoxyribose-phosphate aldolase [candidate division WOR-3 bacterium]